MSGDLDTWVFVDDRPRPASEARIPPLDRGFLYGDSVYEVTRTFGGIPHLLGPHLDRLGRSAAGLEMTLPPRSEIEAAVDVTSRAVPGSAAAGGGVELYLRIVVTRGSGELGLDPALSDTPRLVVIARPVKTLPPEAYRDGVAVMTSTRSRPEPTLKTGNYLASVMAVRDARRHGAHEALLRDAVGRITEGGSSNVFVVRGGRVTTPPVSVGLLPGITRQEVIGLCHVAGVSVDEAPLWPIDLLRAEEMFLSSSIRGVVPITRLDGAPVADGKPGPITRRLLEDYAMATRGAR
jgi:branched-chain amino acid aminotransferase